MFIFYIFAVFETNLKVSNKFLIVLNRSVKMILKTRAIGRTIPIQPKRLLDIYDSTLHKVRFIQYIHTRDIECKLVNELGERKLQSKLKRGHILYIFLGAAGLRVLRR